MNSVVHLSPDGTTRPAPEQSFPRTRRSNKNGKEKPVEKSVANPWLSIRPVDVMTWQQPAPEPEYVLAGLERGTVGAIVGPGGAGKSYLTLQLMMQLATGADLGISPLVGNLSEARPLRVLYICLEDPAKEVWRRAGRIIERFNSRGVDERGVLGPDEFWERLRANLTILDLFGNPDIFSLARHADSNNRKCELTSWGQFLAERCAGYDLVIMDTLSRSHELEENSNPEMAFLLKIFERAATSSNCAFLYIHHFSKGGGTNDDQGAADNSRGASVLTSNCRWQLNVGTLRMDKGKALGFDRLDTKSWVCTESAKVSYGANGGQNWYWRGEGGVLNHEPDGPNGDGGDDGPAQVRNSRRREPSHEG